MQTRQPNNLKVFLFNPLLILVDSFPKMNYPVCKLFLGLRYQLSPLVWKNAINQLNGQKFKLLTKSDFSRDGSPQVYKRLFNFLYYLVESVQLLNENNLHWIKGSSKDNLNPISIIYLRGNGLYLINNLINLVLTLENILSLSTHHFHSQ